MISGSKLTAETADQGLRLDVFVQRAFPTVRRSDIRQALEEHLEELEDAYLAKEPSAYSGDAFFIAEIQVSVFPQEVGDVVALTEMSSINIIFI